MQYPKLSDAEKEYAKMMLKKDVFNTCIHAAITKAKLSSTLLSIEDVEAIINQLEKLKK